MPPSSASASASGLRAVVTPFVVLLLALILAPSSAHAQSSSVDRLLKKMSSSSDYKVRISAALSLSKLGEQRSIPGFVRALRDSDKTVRGVAAAALGKLVNSSSRSSHRNNALTALKKTVSSDSNSFVRKQAQKAYDRLKALGSGGSVSSGGTYVNIGLMSATVPGAAKIRAHMRKTVQTTFKKKASSMVTDWPGSQTPSKKQLGAKRVKAFHVDGTLNELTVTGAGNMKIVSCKVSMLIASYPEKSMFGFLKGGAKVQSSSSEKEIQYAKEDCVAAVMEDLTARKIIPTLKARP